MNLSQSSLPQSDRISYTEWKSRITGKRALGTFEALDIERRYKLCRDISDDAVFSDYKDMLEKERLIAREKYLLSVPKESRPPTGSSPTLPKVSGKNIGKQVGNDNNNIRLAVFAGMCTGLFLGWLLFAPKSIPAEQILKS